MAFFTVPRLEALVILLAALTPRPSVADGETCNLPHFNTTTQGRVQELKPFSLPCFSNYNGQPVTPNRAACTSVQRDYFNPWARTDDPNGYMNSQDEMCSSEPHNQCLLDNSNPANPTAYTNTSCRQGDLPSHYLEIQRVEDVIEAYKYAHCSGTKLSIKNSGHDFLGRSSGKDTLALWTRNLRSMSYSKDFSLSGCSTRHNAITVGSGVNFDEAYAFAEKNNVTLVGGYAPTVGVSGGWVQSGGHSILSPVYGLGIDRVVQYKIVTPDGQYRIANECQNPDLFWALRGGGGGTFGVVMESTHRVEPQIRLVAASIKFPQSPTNALPFLDIVVNHTLQWAAEGWGGHITGNTLVNVSPLLSVSEAEKSLSEVIAYARSQGGSAVVEEFPSWYPFYERYVTSGSVGVGVTHFVGTRLVPKAVFETAEGRKDLMGFFALLLDQGLSPYIPVVGPVLYDYTEGSTSATPAWRSAVWETGAGANWAWNATLEERKEKIAAMKDMTAMFARITPGSGAYASEASPFTVDWREAWWGDNYEELVSIKHKYDPFSLLSCWKCVGWTESQSDSSCFSAFV